MGREPKPEWVARLRGLEGCADADIYFNELLHRWMFRIRGADGIYREQAWAWFYNPLTGKAIPPDEVTGLCPFRELDDAGMDEAIQNLEKTYVGNPFDGAGSPRKEALRRHRYNEALLTSRRRDRADLFVDMMADRGRRMRGGAQSGWTKAREQAATLGPPKKGKPLVEVVNR